MSGTIDIDGYLAVVRFEPDIEMFRGEFVDLNGGADFYAEDVAGLKREGATSLRVFLDMCGERGVEPRKRFSGEFGVRVSPELHADIAAAAAAAGQSIGQWAGNELRLSTAGMRRNPYNGDAGNLAQHWTFCEILAIANRRARELNFIDAHAMAPVASRRRKIGAGGAAEGAVFDRVRGRLPGRKSAYERAWKKLVPEGNGYPNSAAFLNALWKGECALLLCEIDPSTSANIEAWAVGVTNGGAACRNVRVYPGDWRKRFEKGFSGDELTLLSFDPETYSGKRVNREKTEIMYPSDAERLVRAARGLGGGVVVQISTRGANNGGGQGSAERSIDEILAGQGGFERLATVKPDGRAMSLVYGRGIAWANELRPLEDKFGRWLDKAAARGS